MKVKSGYTKPCNQWCLAVYAVINYCLITLLGFLFWSSQTASLVGFLPKQSISHKVGLFFSSAQNSRHSHPPFSIPFVAGELPEEVETPDETWADEHSGIECGNLFHNLLSEVNFHSGAEKNLFAQLALSIQNRPTASLFVLHHAWKSFLI